MRTTRDRLWDRLVPEGDGCLVWSGYHNRANVDDMVAKGRSGYGWQRRKTECKNGHPFTTENTRIDPSTGWRTCRTCKGWTGLDN